MYPHRTDRCESSSPSTKGQQGCAGILQQVLLYFLLFFNDGRKGSISPVSAIPATATTQEKPRRSTSILNTPREEIKETAAVVKGYGTLMASCMYPLEQPGGPISSTGVCKGDTIMLDSAAVCGDTMIEAVANASSCSGTEPWLENSTTSWVGNCVSSASRTWSLGGVDIHPRSQRAKSLEMGFLLCKELPRRT